MFTMSPILMRLAILIALGLSCEGINCGNGTEALPEACIAAPGFPFCVNVALAGTPPRFQCMQCDPTKGASATCDCPANSYCVKDTLLGEQGQCRLYEQDLADTRCSLFPVGVKNVPWPTPDYSILVRGLNDDLACGLYKFNSDNTFRLMEWQGVCQRGKCVVCQDYGGALLAYPHVMCGDRLCVNNIWSSSATSMFLSWEYFWHNPVIMSVMFMFGELSLVLCICLVATACMCCKVRQSSAFAAVAVDHWSHYDAPIRSEAADRRSLALSDDEDPADHLKSVPRRKRSILRR